MNNIFKSRKSSFWFTLACMLIFGSSCISNKKLVYFPNPEFNTENFTNIQNEPKAYRIQPTDILSVRIKTLDSESSAYFNIQAENGLMNINQASVYLSGYTIDEDGNIDLPEAGAVKVAGLTVDEAQQKIKEAVGVYLKNANVIVKLVSFKISVLGEVKSPGNYYIYNDQATLLEGLSIAGDLTDFGNRENITLIRQNKDGMGAMLINLKDPKILASDVFYLQPNDVIYVQPLKAKNRRSNIGTLSALSIIFGAVSTTVLILNYIN